MDAASPAGRLVAQQRLPLGTSTAVGIGNWTNDRNIDRDSERGAACDARSCFQLL